MIQKPWFVSQQAIHLLIDSALKEDVGDGDHSTLSSIPASTTGKSRLIFKGEGLVAGVEMAREIANYIDPAMYFEQLIEEGQECKYGDVVFYLSGSVHSILKAERLILNTMQRMSGIATHTQSLVKIVEGTGVRLLDTRKTTPNFRLAEKWAVKIGGGENHRFGLYDMIMLKDNHVDFAGGVAKALGAAKQYCLTIGRNIPIEVETRNLSEIEAVLSEGGATRIMFDNFSPELMKEAVALVNHRVETEASGGITRQTIRSYAETGVDFISIGALTHSSPIIDMSLKAM